MAARVALVAGSGAAIAAAGVVACAGASGPPAEPRAVRLTYSNSRGLAESVRWVLTAAGVPFEMDVGTARAGRVQCLDAGLCGGHCALVGREVA